MDDTRRAEIEQVIADCDDPAADTTTTLRDAGAALRELLAAYDGALAEQRASGDDADAAPV